MGSIILGIESSCDETSLALVNEQYQVLWHKTSSQNSLHSEYGGVVPELASRRHIIDLFRLMDEISKEKPDLFKAVRAVAVTVCPGLIGSLLVGVETAKTFALCRQIPLIPVHHLKAHIFAASFHQDIHFPFLGLIISGGHTLMCLVENYDNLQVISQSRDDAIGEAYDKVAKVLGYGYPGGPVIDRIHQQFQGDYIDFPQPMKNSMEFSLSGLKTAVIRYVTAQSPLGQEEREKIAASFQQTIIQMLSRKVHLALKKHHLQTLAVVGGVSANKGLRKEFEKLPVKAIFPAFEYCTDNGAMVAGLGMWYYQNNRHILEPGSEEFLRLNASPSSQL